MARKLIMTAQQAKQQAKTQTPENQKDVGFVQGLAQDIARPFLRGAAGGIRSAQIVRALAQKDTETLEKAGEPIDFGYFGKVRPVGISETGEAKGFASALADVAGTGAEIASTFVGGKGAAIAGKQLLRSQLKKTLVTGAKEGAKAGALAEGGRALQEEEGPLGVATGTAIGAGAGAVGGAILSTAGIGVKGIMTPIKTLTQNVAPALEKVAFKIETTLIKPLKREMEKGFKIENVFKYKLEGNLEETFNKSTAKLARLRKKAMELREGTEKTIDIQDIMQQVANELREGKEKLFGVQSKVFNAFESFGKEFEMVAPDGRLTVPQAQEIKEAVGTIGSWLYGQRDLEANAHEKVANILYSKLRKAIEENSGAGLAEINRQMSEIIPIKNAVVRRIPVADRNNLIGLTDVISVAASLQNPSGWFLAVINRLSKSGRVAGKIEEAARRLKSLKPTPPKLLNKKKN